MMPSVHLLGTTRVGQLSGSTERGLWEDSVDAVGWPLLNDTIHWAVKGVDLGANTEHRDGRLYFFFGDVAIEQDPNSPFFTRNPFNSDWVAWTEDRNVLEHGGHLARGWDFFLPNDQQGATDAAGQKDWAFCRRCGGLFFAPRGTAAGVCPKGGAHERHSGSWNFFLPNDHQGATDSTGQRDWRFCANCHGLFFARAGRPAGVCPHDGSLHVPLGWNFFLPNRQQGATERTGQAGWRFCANCLGLFWNDDAFKGLCPGAQGGGFHLHSVNRTIAGEAKPKFAPFTVAPPILTLGSDETPTGAFSYDGKVYVFVWVGTNRDQLHVRGSYLVSSSNPAGASAYDIQLPVFSKEAGNPVGFFQVAPWVIKNAEHPGLPVTTDADGVVMFGQGRNTSIGTDAIHLAWMPLRPGVGPVRQQLRYYTGVGDGWSADSTQAAPLFPLDDHYTSVSVAWLSSIRRWILIYSEAINKGHFSNFQRPLVVRIGTHLWQWSDRMVLFDPVAADMYGAGRLMHWPGGDSMHLANPPLPPFAAGSTTERENLPGWCYGAFLVDRFTKWDGGGRELTIHYLMSTGRPYQVQLMRSKLHVAQPGSMSRLFDGGNGVLLGVSETGDLRWYRYEGEGEADVSGSTEWHPNSGNRIGNRWHNFRHLVGCGDGVILGIQANGDLRWHRYEGGGEDDVSGSKGWHPNSGNRISRNWHRFRRIFALSRDAAGALTIFAIAQNGDLHWHSYAGHGEEDPAGVRGWHPNSGNRVENGWHGFLHLHGTGNVILGVAETGNLHWYSYGGNGENDVTGSTGWHANSGNPIGTGWQRFQHLLGSPPAFGRPGHVIFAVAYNRDLLWYRYEGRGEADVSGASGWHPNSGNPIGNGW